MVKYLFEIIPSLLETENFQLLHLQTNITKTLRQIPLNFVGIMLMFNKRCLFAIFFLYFLVRSSSLFFLFRIIIQLPVPPSTSLPQSDFMAAFAFIFEKSTVYVCTMFLFLLFSVFVLLCQKYKSWIRMEWVSQKDVYFVQWALPPFHFRSLQWPHNIIKHAPLNYS